MKLQVQPSEFGLEESKAQELIKDLSITLKEREILKEAFIDVSELEVCEENIPTFKELRLKIVKNRTQGIEKWHKTQKAFYLAGGRFVDAIKNKEIAVNQEMEEKLLDAEKHFENLEKERVEKLNQERIKLIEPYVDDIFGLDLGNMQDDVFEAYLESKKKQHAEKIEAEKKAEAERLEFERLVKQRETRSRMLLNINGVKENDNMTFTLKNMLDEKMSNVVDAKDVLDSDEETFQKYFQEFKCTEEDNATYIENQRAENERLKKEREAAEQKRLAEEKKRKAEEAKKQAEYEANLKKEREAREKLEREEKARKDAEKAEADRKAKEEEEKRKEAERLAKAPVKEKLSLWVDSFELPETSVNNGVSKEIQAKFQAFKKWSINQIKNL